MTPAFVTALMLLQAPVPEPPPPPPSAWATTFSVEGVFRNWIDDPDSLRKEDILDGMNRVYGLATRPGVEAGVQLDVAAAYPKDRAGLVGPQTPPPGWTTGLFFSTKEDVQASLEKKFVRLRADAGSLEFGDSYRAVGRGIALALVKNSTLDIDTSIEGAAGDFALGNVEGAAWGGYSNQQTISTTFQNHIQRDVRDAVIGARAGARISSVQLFTHANTLRIDRRAPASVFMGADLVSVRDVRLAGAGFEASDLGGVVDLYAEGNLAAFRVKNDEVIEDAEGHGFYGAATAYLGPVTLVAEGKRYLNLELMNVRQSEGTAQPYDYSTPPTLEKENLVNKNTGESVNSNDIYGGRLTASLGMGSTIARAAFAHFEDRGHERALYDADETIEHVYGGLERRWAGSFAQVTAGYRYETRQLDASVHDTQAHLDLDLLFDVGTVQIEGKYLVYRQISHEPITGERFTWDVNDVILSIRPFRWLSVAGLIATTTDEGVLGGLGGREGNLSRYTFGAAEIAVEPGETSIIRVFAGATQGGLKCSGGTCRVIPAFEGVRLEWAFRF